jgi:hypothetical protein
MTYNFESQDALIALKTSFSKLLSKSVFTLDIIEKDKEESPKIGRSRPKRPNYREHSAEWIYPNAAHLH